MDIIILDIGLWGRNIQSNYEKNLSWRYDTIRLIKFLWVKKRYDSLRKGKARIYIRGI